MAFDAKREAVGIHNLAVTLVSLVNSLILLLGVAEKNFMRPLFRRSCKDEQVFSLETRLKRERNRRVKGKAQYQRTDSRFQTP